MWEGFIDSVVASGALPLSGVDMSTVYNVSHTTPPMPWIDPKKEIEAAILAEQHMYESKGSIIRRRGGSPDQTYREIERDRSKRERLGLDEPDVDDLSSDDSEDDSPQAVRSRIQFRNRRAQ